MTKDENVMTAVEFNKLVDLLASGKYKDNIFAIGLAKTHPIMFMQVADEIELPPAPMLPKLDVRTIIHSLKLNDRIHAIRAIREGTGFGLLEAKQVSDFMSDYMHRMGYADQDRTYGTYEIDFVLDDMQRHVVEKLTVQADKLFCRG